MAAYFLTGRDNFWKEVVTESATETKTAFGNIGKGEKVV
jgi:hypothetical protein